MAEIPLRNALKNGYKLCTLVKTLKIDGKATTHLFGDGHAPKKITIKSFQVILDQVPDGGATNYTAKLSDGTNDVTTTVTFAQGTDAAGALKAGVVDATYQTIASGKTIDVVTSGTTTTAGECTVIVTYEAYSQNK